MEKNRVFFIMPTQVNGQGEYNALIAVEGEKGYYKTDWFWGKDLKIAEQIAQESNDVMGINKEQANKIVVGTMAI